MGMSTYEFGVNLLVNLFIAWASDSFNQVPFPDLIQLNPFAILDIFNLILSYVMNSGVLIQSNQSSISFNFSLALFAFNYRSVWFAKKYSLLFNTLHFGS